MAGCLWHKRPEPGLDPSHLWEKKKKNMGMRKGEEAWQRREWQLERERKTEAERVSETDSDEDTERHMCRRCVYMCVCFRERQSVTPRIRISLHDSPPDQHTWTHKNTLSYISISVLLIHIQQYHKCPYPNVFTASTGQTTKKKKNTQETFVEEEQRLCTRSCTETIAQIEWGKERKTEKCGWKRKIQALKYLKLLCGYI